MMRKIPALFIRGGTSKGLFINTQTIPEGFSLSDKILARMLGSPDPFKEQIDGMGGATSSKSKVVLLRRSNKEGFDVDYNFGQVDVERGEVDYKGSCGNMVAGVGLYAVYKDLVKVSPDQRSVVVNVWQVNTKKKITVEVPCQQGRLSQNGDFILDGVSFPAALYKVRYFMPGFGQSSLIFPTGRPVDPIEVQNRVIEASLVDVSNPTIFIRARDAGLQGDQLSLQKSHLEFLEKVRCKGGVMMGLGKDESEIKHLRKATPKISFLSPPKNYTASDGRKISSQNCDINARILSMGQLHHTFTATGLMALGACASVRQSIAGEFTGGLERVRIGHRGGVSNVSSRCEGGKCEWVEGESSARLLMQGDVFF